MINVFCHYALLGDYVAKKEVPNYPVKIKQTTDNIF